MTIVLLLPGAAVGMFVLGRLRIVVLALIMIALLRLTGTVTVSEALPGSGMPSGSVGTSLVNTIVGIFRSKSTAYCQRRRENGRLLSGSASGFNLNRHVSRMQMHLFRHNSKTKVACVVSESETTMRQQRI